MTGPLHNGVASHGIGVEQHPPGYEHHHRATQNAALVVHGVLLEVLSLGVLLTGQSGCGKSELALDLISRGHRLIADDTVELQHRLSNVIEGSCPRHLRDFLEVRGLGILNIRRMFGDSAMKPNHQIQLIIDLVSSNDAVSAESRLQGTRYNRVMLGVEIPVISLPFGPGRNGAVLCECAVRDQILRLQGYSAAEELTKRLQREMTRKPRCE